MLENLIPQHFLHADGTTQSQRPLEALAPGYAVPDARTTADLLELAQHYARFIRFYGEDNVLTGSWEAFLPGQAPGTLAEPGPAGPPWLADLSAYLHDPHAFASQPELQHRLSRPHLVLFLAFLELLEPVRQQLNGFTGRHLDYVYRQVLGMDVKKAVPDLVHVVVSLAEDVDHLFLEQGTALLAGTDSLGKELVYRVNKSTGISRARVQRSARQFADKASLTIKSAREQAAFDSDAGFLRMLQFAHSFLRPGEVYPDELRKLTAASLDNLQQRFFISQPDATALLELQEDSRTGRASSAQWDKAYFTLEQAFKDKTISDRQQALKAYWESTESPSYAGLLRFAFGVLGVPPAPPTSAGPAANPLADAEDDELQALAKANLTPRELANVLSTTAAAGSASAEDWQRVYVALERAARKHGNFTLPVPLKEVWGDVYARDDARTDADASPVLLARLGFAVGSPQLALAEGVRELQLTCSFQRQPPGRLDQLRAALAAQPEALTWALSSRKGWVEAAPENPPVFGDFIIGSAEKAYPFAVLDGEATKADNAKFTADEIGKYLVTADGTVYLVADGPAPAPKVRVTPQGKAKVNADQPAGLYGPQQVYLAAMQVRFVRQPTDPPVEAPGGADSQWPISADVPLLALRLNQTPPDAPAKKRQDAEALYQLLRELKLERLKVEVAVTGIRTLRLQNDYGSLSSKKPFEPFGPAPQPGNSLYIAHPELSSKQLNSLTLTPQWMGEPKDFRGYYENYWKIRAQRADLTEADRDIKNNDSIKAELKVVDQQTTVQHQPVSLFPASPATAWKISLPARRGPRPDEDWDETDLTEWPRYFQLELEPGSPDLQHTAYSNLLVQQALLDSVVYKDLRQLRLNPPYTPLLKSLTAGYTASFEVKQGDGAGAKNQVFHLGTFGYKALPLTPNTPFLPYPEYRSELLLGLSRVDTPQILPLFLQLADAAAQPDLLPGPVAWSYLTGNEWQPLGEAAIVSDTTDGLLHSGIVELQLPAGRPAENTWLPDGLYWLKAGFEAPIEAIPPIIDVQAQGISASFEDQGNAPDHLLLPLPPGSITQPRADIPAIARLQQPYHAAKGRPAESPAVFYNRVSERIRHKNRALTPWDYERIVLEEFPQIYKAKCLPATALGGVDLIVIPDIRGKLPAPAEPRASVALLHQIQQFVEQRAPAHAAVQVRNPAYVRVKVRAAIKIRPGYGEAHSVRDLEADLKRYLAPWAYEEGIDLVVGGKLYPDMIVNFIAAKPYVEFAANVVLFLSEDGQRFTPITKLLDGSDDPLRTLRPDAILVSAPEHVFDIIRENRFEERLLTGIGYAKMGLDFAVG